VNATLLLFTVLLADASTSKIRPVTLSEKAKGGNVWRAFLTESKIVTNTCLRDAQASLNNTADGLQNG
jgi:hypothetical protein